jgi:hypothetical protein
MDFVERIFRIAPDGGNATPGAAIFMVPMFMLFLACRKIPLLHLLTRPTNRWTRWDEGEARTRDTRIALAPGQSRVAPNGVTASVTHLFHECC